METQHEIFKEVSTEFVDLLINLGIINSISDDWPEEVQQNWVARLTAIKDWATDQIREVQEFGSAFDED